MPLTLLTKDKAARCYKQTPTIQLKLCQHMSRLTYHVQQRLLHLLALREAAGPVVARAATLLGDEDVLRVEQVGDVGGLDAVDHAAADKQTKRQTCGKVHISLLGATWRMRGRVP